MAEQNEKVLLLNVLRKEYESSDIENSIKSKE